MKSCTSDDVRKLGRMIKGIETVMLTTVDSQGRMHSRPMASIQHEFDGTLWFFTRADAPKVKEIERDPRVNVSYGDGEHRFVAIVGTAVVVRDPEKVRELWGTTSHRTWFPQGLSDPELILLRVKVDCAEYWSAPGGDSFGKVDFAA